MSCVGKDEWERLEKAQRRKGSEYEVVWIGLGRKILTLLLAILQKTGALLLEKCRFMILSWICEVVCEINFRPVVDDSDVLLLTFVGFPH